MNVRFNCLWYRENRKVGREIKTIPVTVKINEIMCIIVNFSFKNILHKIAVLKYKQLDSLF